MKILLTGHRGLLGSSLMNILSPIDGIELITCSRTDVDLTDSIAVSRFFQNHLPDVVIMAAAKVGGISNNIAYPYEFLMTNTKIQTALFDACVHYKTQRIIFFGSSCMYPRDCSQPMHESQLWNGPVEETSKSYAIAKLVGMEMARICASSCGIDTVTIIPSVMYGPHDNFRGDGHVISSLIAKFHHAKINQQSCVTLLGSGNPLRDFVFVDDVARFCLKLILMPKFPVAICNIGSGLGISISELSTFIAQTVDYSGSILWNTNFPDGAPEKILDSGIARSIGWSACTSLTRGLELTYAWYIS